ncbi:MGH1-like glycoside hydrolase domain-containing protein [Olivibacter sitiensis]|uniref:MGH1-like glycoside hydrolase domain-containing protein n=1 Tax=Olivibacter sitiensis TaxID=376470 RepID=UPI00042A168B|nr:glucosidase [Olivibacter sitiensis]
MNEETRRLAEEGWKKWGPYVSNRQWGTVREDYSQDGNAWNYTTHDMARSTAYRWGEEGIGGICDDKQLLCFAPSFWNGRDSIMKEIFFGLSNNEGNHGEDVKELFYYLDSSPTHSYMKMLYKYPQQAFPYQKLVEENRHRDKKDPEYEIMDTGIFEDDAYFDIFIEYAKIAQEDILIKITVHNRGKEKAPLSILPTVWFRNTWSWGYEKKALCSISKKEDGYLEIEHPHMANYFLYQEQAAPWLFTENETNLARFQQPYEGKKYFKDAFHDYVVRKDKNAIKPVAQGTKAAAFYTVELEGGSSCAIRLRLCRDTQKTPFKDFDTSFQECLRHTDEFYAPLQASIHSEDEKRIHRQALAGLLWNKQFYYYNVYRWLDGDPGRPLPMGSRASGRNSNWKHLNNHDIISMPDKWEFPWYASWDLAFHCVSLALVDSRFAKQQLMMLTKEWYMHPNGQIPAYEWNFEDTNPPVHAWATWEVYNMEKKVTGKGDIPFLEAIFQKLIINFTWWVNRKDHRDKNIFSGGFLGLDNIGVFDRNMGDLPEGVVIEQADGTSWMAMYALNMVHISLELAQYNPVYGNMTSKFFEHFIHISSAILNITGTDDMGLWDEEEGFFFDELSIENNPPIPLKLRSIVGLIPLFAVEVISEKKAKASPQLDLRKSWYLRNRNDLMATVSSLLGTGNGEKYMASLIDKRKMKRILKRMLDCHEFLSDYGIRSLSKCYEKEPYIFTRGNEKFTVHYTPGESDTDTYGGNSNWRGPIWIPINYLIIQSLLNFYQYYGDSYMVEYPTGSGKLHNLKDISTSLTNRIIHIFKRDEEGKRACFGQNEKMQTDPHFKDYLLFNEYFHGDTGKGLGASHQTGWTALIANLIQQFP